MRDNMKDRKSVKSIEGSDPIRDFNHYVNKYKNQGFKGDELWKKIINSSARANKDVNKKYGIH